MTEIQCQSANSVQPIYVTTALPHAKVNGPLWQSGLCVSVRERGSSRCGNTQRSPLHVRVLPSPPVAAADARSHIAASEGDGHDCT